MDEVQELVDGSGGGQVAYIDGSTGSICGCGSCSCSVHGGGVHGSSGIHGGGGHCSSVHGSCDADGGVGWVGLGSWDGEV